MGLGLGGAAGIRVDGAGHSACEDVFVFVMQAQLGGTHGCYVLFAHLNCTHGTAWLHKGLGPGPVPAVLPAGVAPAEEVVQDWIGSFVPVSCAWVRKLGDGRGDSRDDSRGD